MPPASLSTLEVIRPGPTTARNTRDDGASCACGGGSFEPRDFQMAAVGSRVCGGVGLDFKC